MNKELEIWQFAAKSLEQNEAVMLLVVAESLGSSPGRQGFKMIVAEDEMCGSIGGGMMEVNLVEQARTLLTAGTSNSLIRQQVHQKNSSDPSGMICSGRQSVIFFRLTPSHLDAVNEIAHALDSYEPKTLRVTPDEFVLCDLAGKEPPGGGTQNECATQNENFFYEETLGHKNRLFIIGGGHCALALSELMSRIDFHISLFDDRPNLNTLAKNRYAHEKSVIESYENIADFIPAGANNFVVVMTLGYKSDEIVIRKLLDREFKYFGVLGSKAKMAVLLKDLQKEGFPKEKLDRIHTPIGLQINSQTPEEIAVSIAAEIIAVKNSAN